MSSHHITHLPASNPLPAYSLPGQPVLAHPPLIQGTFHHAISGQVASLPTALVHLHMDNLELGHPQVNVLDSYFQPYFPEKSYHFSHLPFNLATEESLLTYERAAMDLTHSLSSLPRVVLLLTTHSDEERGDLFAGHLDDKPVAFKVSECLQVLLNPLTKIVQGADIILYVCGSIVTVKDSFNDLKEAAHKFKPRSMILFDAQHLQLASTTPYLLSLLDSTIVQGFDVFQAAKTWVVPPVRVANATLKTRAIFPGATVRMWAIPPMRPATPTPRTWVIPPVRSTNATVRIGHPQPTPLSGHESSPT
ncbi:hypothetical protein EDD16DRAFT_1705038 [Pisolithus croceorrhizus]|nr:hypothetical protein EDD16DRAFT_1705038 [Pisolithus croceorrhizus]